MSNVKPLVSIILPLYNEEAILKGNLAEVIEYMRGLESDFRWEVLLINDGSADSTGAIADELANGSEQIRAYHHLTNYGLGKALKYGFAMSRGDYVISLDIDLSYDPPHIGLMLERAQSTGAKLVLASPYMKGGKLSSVPFMRRVLSVVANWFLGLVSHGRISTLTCLTRCYEGNFARSLNLRALGMDVMPEIIYKTMILRGAIEQVPAHLDWSRQVVEGATRTSSMRIISHLFGTLVSGFMIRPFLFFLFSGLILLGLACYSNIWMIIHLVEAYTALGSDASISGAVRDAFAEFPHTFVIAMLLLMLSVQLISLGLMALQSKRYFEESFHAISELRNVVERLAPAIDTNEIGVSSQSKPDTD